MQKIINYTKQIINTKLFKDLSVVFSENVITKALNFVIILLLTRILGPEDYGKYSFIFVSMAFISGVFDFGMENTAVRFSGKEKTLRNSIFGLYFITKIFIISGVILSLIFFGDNIFGYIKKSNLIEYIPFLIIGIIGESLFFVNDTYLQAIQKYKFRAILNISKYSLNVIFICILALKKIVYLKYIFCMYFIPLIITLFFIPQYIEFVKSYFQNKLPIELFSNILDYEKWMFTTSIGINLLQRVDFFMLAYWVNYAQIGIYNAATQLSAIFSFLPYVFGKVMLPKMAELKEIEIFNFIKRISKPLIITSLFMLICIPLVDYIVPFLLGKEYLTTIPVLKLLLLAFITAFIVAPIEQALYSLGKPQIITKGRFLQLFVIIVLNVIIIPKFGIIGAAFNMLFVKTLYLLLIINLFKMENKKVKGKLC